MSQLEGGLVFKAPVVFIRIAMPGSGLAGLRYINTQNPDTIELGRHYHVSNSSH